MGAYEYAALDKKGRTRRGVLEGDTARQVRQQLREQGFMPLAVEQIVRPSVQRQRRGIFVTATDLALLTRQLATLVRAGLALEEALRAVSEQTEKRRLKTILLAIRSRVLEGHSLVEGLNEFPTVFSDLYRATVAAGEQAGHLDLVLERLAEYTENRQMIQQKTLLALFYPALLTVVALLIVVGLLVYVVPQVVQVFNNLNQTLPLLTRILIMFSELLQQWGIWLFFLLVLLGIGLRYLLSFEPALRGLHGLLLRLPLISRLERGANVARFTRTLSILTESGVPLLEALQITSQVVANRVLREGVLTATDKVREGSSLHEALKKSGLFPAMTVYLIASGETSGNLEKMLERAAIMQERELDALISVLLNLFEPLLILLMGAMVLTIVMAIMMPIFELNQLIK